MRVRYTDLTKEGQQQALALCLEARGELFNLGKKISVPQDVMMEELTLCSNRGSRMFQERQKRVERFTLESVGSRHESDLEERCLQVASGIGPVKGLETRQSLLHQGKTQVQEATIPPGKTKTGNPSVLAPGYSGPLKEVPHEKFNVTIIPKSYCSPWEESSDSKALLANINTRLPEPPHKLTPAEYKCFNRAPMPFEGTAGSVRKLPLPGFEMQQAFTEPCLTWERMCDRPNFNRTPEGWKAQYSPETRDL